MRLRQIMSTKVKTAFPDELAKNAWDRMRRHKLHHLVVTISDGVVGVVSERDLGGRSGPSSRLLRVVDCMNPRAVTAPPNATTRRAANLMRGRSIGCLPIIENHKLVGIVTLSDMLELIAKGNVGSSKFRRTPRQRSLNG
jgi:acetoin utilization protein AcuB